MTLYILEWDNELEYGDNQVTLLGIYKRVEGRELAKKHYQEYGEQWPFNDRKTGKFVESEIEADHNLIEKK